MVANDNEQDIATSDVAENKPAATEKELLKPENKSGQAQVSTIDHKSRKTKLILAVFVVCMLTIAFALIWYFANRSKPTGPVSTKSTSTTVKSTFAQSTYPAHAKICFLRLDYLECVDNQGQNRVRYSIPLPNDQYTVTSLVASPDQSQFLAEYKSYSSPTDASTIWLLNDKLQMIKQINFPKGATLPIEFSSFIFTRDEKSIILFLTTAKEQSFNNAAIYSYNITSGNFTRLSSWSANYLGSLAQIGDNQLIYGYTNTSGQNLIEDISMTGQKQAPYNLPTPYISGGKSFSYDWQSNTLFATSSQPNSSTPGQDTSPILEYINTADLVKNKPFIPLSSLTSSLPASVSLQTPLALFTNQANILFVFEGYQAQIFNIATNTLINTFVQAGTPVGLLETTDFTPSAIQTEQASDNIIGFSTAPADVQQLALSIFNTNSPQCTQSDSTSEFDLTISAVVRDSFTDIQSGCTGSEGNSEFYAKVNGVWIFTGISNQAVPECSVVNEYAYTKILISECLSSSAKDIANNNP